MGVSLWGLFEYTNEDLFDAIELTPLLNKDNLIQHLIDKWGQVDLYQSDPRIVRRKINTFFLLNYDNFAKMAEVLQAEYNPIENYDRNETTGEVRDTGRSGSNNNTTANTGTSENNTSSTGSTVDNVGGYNVEHTVSAFNENTYQPSSKDTTSARSDSGTNTNAMASDGRTTENEQQNGMFAENTLDDFNRTSRVHGNIGVTTSQQMIQSELELRKFNIYDYIADLFAGEFLMRVY